METTLAPLAHWESFYVIVGSSAGALTGLQFVVIALVADVKMRSSSTQIDAFATPTIVHFGAALFLAAALSVPWGSLAPLAVLLGVAGVAGLAYTWIVIRRARRQTGYAPVFEDWLWHAALPALAYAAILGSAVALITHEGAALFLIAAVALLLVFIGIHNAWDAVTFITLQRLDGLAATNTTEPPRPEAHESEPRESEPRKPVSAAAGAAD
ncbi:MAG TPA: hypothetical protein VJU87_12425 [Gemmatimonadaceae bacterium]|nr:hypothetical protein [Gemmatimonadaceae bacterium]